MWTRLDVEQTIKKKTDRLENYFGSVVDLTA